MTDSLTRAFKELLNQERFGSQSEIVEALKNQGFTYADKIWCRTYT